MRVGILYSRVRAEEKLLFEEFDRRGVVLDLVDDNSLVFDITAAAHARHFQGFDVVVERCISHGRALYSLRILNEVLIRQTEQIDRLEALCRQLKERLDRLGDGSQEKLSLAEEVPPHY